jgi:pyrimidine-nucleoside phosphorylase
MQLLVAIYGDARVEQLMPVNFNPVDLIRKKRLGDKLNESEIEYLVSAYTRGIIADYQMSAFLMAVCFQEMDFNETTCLMEAMRDSGEVLDLSAIKLPKVDKHSTGGVGDKVSLVLAPLVSSCGLCVPMISGRGLGHTGGTLDKLESIPGFKTNLTTREFKDQLERIGIGIIGQTAAIAPADRKMYALRDVTATVDSIPLISASIMSKKLAEDLDGLVLDVKFGSGAFMESYGKAKELARTMVAIGKRSRVKTRAVLTNMDNPLGTCVGNSLEVIESVEALKGKGSKDLIEVTLTLGQAMLSIAGIRGGRRFLESKINSGAALNKFREMIEYQGGDARVVDDYTVLRVAERTVKALSPKRGYVHAIDCYTIGMLLVKMGGGRSRKEDDIDHSCGFKIHKKTGDPVARGELIAEIYSDQALSADELTTAVTNAFIIKQKPCRSRKLIREEFL